MLLMYKIYSIILGLCICQMIQGILYLVVLTALLCQLLWTDVSTTDNYTHDLIFMPLYQIIWDILS